MNKFLLKQLYSAFIQSYLNYANVAWASTHKSKLQTIYRHQKHAIRIINFKDRFTHTRPLFEEMKILSVYEINIYQVLSFMFTCKVYISPVIFSDIFKSKPPNKYTMRNQYLVEPKIKTKFEEFSISFRGPRLWNKIVIPNSNLVNLEHLLLFKHRIKAFLLGFKDILDYF